MEHNRNILRTRVNGLGRSRHADPVPRRAMPPPPGGRAAVRKGWGTKPTTESKRPRGACGPRTSADSPPRAKARLRSRMGPAAHRARRVRPAGAPLAARDEPNRRRHSTCPPPPATAATPEPDEPAPATSLYDTDRSGRGSQRLSFRALAAIAAASAFFTLSNGASAVTPASVTASTRAALDKRP